MAWVSPRVWASSAIVTAAQMNEISSSLNAIGDKPATYAPTTNGAFGSNFTITGTNQEVGKWTQFGITIAFTGTPSGAGVVTITLPSTPSADYINWSGVGTCSVRHVSTSSTATGVAVYAGGSNVTAYFGPSNNRLQNAYPYTFASGDIIYLQGRYYRD